MAKKKKASSGGKSIGAKGFLVLHIEKIVFATIALLSLVLVYLGMSGGTISSNKNPADLKKKAEVTLASVVNDSHWDQINTEAGRSHTDSFVRVTNPIDSVEWKEPRFFPLGIHEDIERIVVCQLGNRASVVLCHQLYWCFDLWIATLCF